MPRTLLVLALMCAALGIPAVARADGDPDPTAVEAARAEFADGTTQYRAKKWADALKSFEQSYQVVPSPNALLMIARCQRELGHTADAASSYSNAEAEAKKRVAKGESKYADTAQAAVTEGNAVRKGLGALKIHVAHPNGTTLSVDGKVVPLSGDGEVVYWHEAGAATVTATDASGNEQKQTATVAAGAAIDVNIAAPEMITPGTDPETPLPPPKKQESSGPKVWPGWFLPAAVGAGGTTVIAGGLGIFFGLSSQSTYKDLYSTCGPNKCGAAQRDQADSGSRAQTVANVAYVVAAVGLVATAVIIYFGLKSSGSTNGPL